MSAPTYVQSWQPLACSKPSCNVTFPKENQNYKQLFVFFSKATEKCAIELSAATSIGTITEMEKPYIIKNNELVVHIKSKYCTSYKLWLNMVPVTKGL